MARGSASLLLAGWLIVLPMATVSAQNSTNNPDHEAGAEGSQVATPQRPSGKSNPALTTGTLPKAANANVPPDKNPNVGGATGHTIVHGTSSTVAGDRKKTIAEKTGK